MASEPFLFRGPCAFCDHPDARHRTFEAIRDRHSAGESVKEIARDYGVRPDHIRAVLEANNEH